MKTSKSANSIQTMFHRSLAWVIVAMSATFGAAQAAPTISGVYSYDGVTVGVEFSVPVNSTSAQTAGNYSVSGTTVASATLLADGQSVAVTLSSPSQITGQFVVTVNNVEDLSLNPIAPGSTATNTVLNLTTDVFGDADLEPDSATYTGNYATLVAGGSDLYGAGDNFVFEYLAVTNDFDYRARVVSISNDGQAFDRSGLMVRDTLDTDIYGHEVFVARNGGPNAGNTSADSAQVTLRFTLDDTSDTTFSEPPNPLPAFYGSNSWVRLQRSGTIFTSYYSSNGVDWVQLYQFDGSSTTTPDGIAEDGAFTNSVLYLGLATCAHNNATTTTNVVNDLGVTPLEPVQIFTQPPATATWRENTSASLTVGASGVPAPAYQWRTNGVPIPGATNATFSVASVQAFNAGTYSVLVYNSFSSVLSSNCVVTYSSDTTPPTINGVYSFDGLTVSVEFDKLVGAGSTTTANYTVSGTTVTGAALAADGQSVILTLGSQITGSFIVTVNNVQDSAGNTIAGNSEAAGTVLSLTMVPFGDAVNEPYSATYAGNFATLVAGGSDLYGAGDNFVFEYLAVTNDFDYSAKVVSISNDGQSFDRSGLMVRDSLTDIYAHEVLVARNGGPNAGNSSPDSAQVTLRYTLDDTTDFTYSEPGNPLPAFYGSNSWVRLQRTGTIFTSYYSSNGVNWVQLYQFDGSATNVYDTNSATTLTVDGAFTNSVLYLGLATCAHNAAVTTTNVMSDLASLVPPTITTQPASETLYSGQVANFSVSAYGSPSVTYQWQVNGTNIPGATGSTLTVPVTASGTYDVVVSTPAGESTVSSVVTLTAVTPAKPYEKAVLADGPVAYWRLNETNNPASSTVPAFDYISGFNGTYGINSSNGFTGVVGPGPAAGFNGFGINNTALGTINGPANSYVTGGTLNLNTNRVTLTGWIEPNGAQNGAAGLILCRGASDGDGLAYNGTTLGYNWNGNYWWVNSGMTIPSGVWSFIALVITPTNATMYLYNSSGLRSYTDPETINNQPFSAPIYIGYDPCCSPPTRTFNGTIDEVAVFNYSLTQTQIQQLYLAGVSPLTISPSGGNAIVNWNSDSGFLLEANSVTGPWTTNSSTPPYTNVPAAAEKFYRLQLQ